MGYLNSKVWNVFITVFVYKYNKAYYRDSVLP